MLENTYHSVEKIYKPKAIVGSYLRKEDLPNLANSYTANLYGEMELNLASPVYGFGSAVKDNLNRLNYAYTNPHIIEIEDREQTFLPQVVRTPEEFLFETALRRKKEKEETLVDEQSLEPGQKSYFKVKSYIEFLDVIKIFAKDYHSYHTSEDPRIAELSVTDIEEGLEMVHHEVLAGNPNVQELPYFEIYHERLEPYVKWKRAHVFNEAKDSDLQSRAGLITDASKKFMKMKPHQRDNLLLDLGFSRDEIQGLSDKIKLSLLTYGGFMVLNQGLGNSAIVWGPQVEAIQTVVKEHPILSLALSYMALYGSQALAGELNLRTIKESRWGSNTMQLATYLLASRLLPKGKYKISFKFAKDKESLQDNLTRLVSFAPDLAQEAPYLIAAMTTEIGKEIVVASCLGATPVNLLQAFLQLGVLAASKLRKKSEVDNISKKQNLSVYN